MPSIPYELDEFRPFRASNGDRLEIVVYGEAEIEYGIGPCGDDWHVTGLKIDAGHMQLLSSAPGAPPKSRWIGGSIAIDPGHHMWKPIVEAIYAHERADVEDAIREDRESNDEPIGNPNGEHRFGHHEYGLPR